MAALAIHLVNAEKFFFRNVDTLQALTQHQHKSKAQAPLPIISLVSVLGSRTAVTA
jgi:hypothetical protein